MNIIKTNCYKFNSCKNNDNDWCCHNCIHNKNLPTPKDWFEFNNDLKGDITIGKNITY